jgi:hypothetical protein
VVPLQIFLGILWFLLSFLLVAGAVLLFGIILMSYQVHSWTDRIHDEKQRLRKTE